MAPKKCWQCGHTEFETDLSAGTVVCKNCIVIVEENVLVSEVGFSEGSGGRMHVTGTFVGHGATGFRGGGHESSDNVKKQGHERIRLTGQQMRIDDRIWLGAQRFFTLAVDAKFNKGRRSEYLVASCLYLKCRYEQSPKMLIDFSERLGINVFELGATYLRLRSALMLKDPMPEVDPAIYNIRFAHRLDFKREDVGRVAQDASKLIRRFKADWMTQGRRPAGVCGACMVIAARMSGYLRTCEEVAQVVRVSPDTVRRRLMEFAKTQMATKTVQEWRDLPDEEVVNLDVGEEPPIVRENRRRAEMAAEKARMLALRLGEEEEQDAGEGEGDEEVASGSEEEDEDGRPRKKRRKGKGREGEGEGEHEEMPEDHAQTIGAIEAAAAELEAWQAENGGGDDGDAEADDVDMPEMERIDFIEDLNRAGDDPEAQAKARKAEARAFQRSNRVIEKEVEDEEAVLPSDDEAEMADEDAFAYDDDDDDENETKPDHPVPKPDEFTDWDDVEKTHKYIGEMYFQDEIQTFKLTQDEISRRVAQWIAQRDPRLICAELALIDKARKERERNAKRRPETDFADLDDAELEGYYKLETNELRMRTRVWLSNNGRWLEEEKEKQIKRAAYNKAHNIDPNKPKPKKKRNTVTRKGPYNSAREAVETFATVKKFSSRINYGVLKTLGMGDGDDEKDDDYGANGLETLDEDYGIDFDEKGGGGFKDEKADDDDPNNW